MTSKMVIFFAACGILNFGGAVMAQSVTAPAGDLPATAPGGTEGRAGIHNERDALRSGDGVLVTPAPSLQTVPRETLEKRDLEPEAIKRR